MCSTNSLQQGAAVRKLALNMDSDPFRGTEEQVISEGSTVFSSPPAPSLFFPFHKVFLMNSRFRAEKKSHDKKINNWRVKDHFLDAISPERELRALQVRYGAVHSFSMVM